MCFKGSWDLFQSSMIRHVGTEMTVMKLRSLYSSLETGSLVCHAGPHGEAQGWTGGERWGNVSKSFSCGFCGKEEARQGKQVWDGLV